MQDICQTLDVWPPTETINFCVLIILLCTARVTGTIAEKDYNNLGPTCSTNVFD